MLRDIAEIDSTAFLYSNIYDFMIEFDRPRDSGVTCVCTITELTVAIANTLLGAVELNRHRFRRGTSAFRPMKSKNARNGK